MPDHYFLIPGGSLVPAGDPTIAGATPVSPLSVSMKTIPQSEAWFKFTANTGGLPYLNISFDAFLCYDPVTKEQFWNYPSVGLDIYTPNTGSPTTLSDLTLVASSSTGFDDVLGFVYRGQISQNVEDGQTYYIRLSPSADAILFLRTSDYGVYTGWEQGPDQVWQSDFPGSYGSGGGSLTGYTPDTPALISGTHVIPGGQAGPTFLGRYQLDHGFAHPIYPGQDTNALQCLWDHARAGRYNLSTYWTIDGLVGDGSGTTAACVYRDTGEYACSGVSDHTVGFHFENNQSTGGSGGGHQTIYLETYAISQTLGLKAIFDDFGPNAGAALDSDLVPFPDVPGGFTGNSEYETTTPTLVKLEAMGVILDGATVGADGDGDPTWLVNLRAHGDAFMTDQDWGPKFPYFDGARPIASSWAGQGPHSSGSPYPEDYVANADVLIAENSWTDITALCATAIANEAAWDPTVHTEWQGALVFGCVPYHIQDSVYYVGVTRASPSSGGTIQKNVRNSRNVVVFRYTVRPARLRWIGTAFPPVVDQFNLGGWALEGYGNTSGWAVGSRSARWKRGERYGDLVSRSDGPEQAAC